MSTPRFMAPTGNSLAREREHQHRGALENLQNQPNNSWAQGAAFVFNSAPPAEEFAMQLPRCASLAKARLPPRMPTSTGGARVLGALSAKAATKHIAGNNDGKRRRCARPSASPSVGAGVDRCADKLEEVIALRVRLYELEQRKEPEATLYERLSIEAGELQNRIRGEGARGLADQTAAAELAFGALFTSGERESATGMGAPAAPPALDEGFVDGANFDIERGRADRTAAAELAFGALFTSGERESATGAGAPAALPALGDGFIDGANFDIERVEAEAADDHRWTIGHDFVSGEPHDADKESWKPQAGAGSASYHFV